MSTQISEPMFYTGEISEKSLQIVDDFNFDPKDLDNTGKHYERRIAGLANTPLADRVNDVVDSTAFNESLVRYKKNPILRRNHKAGKIIGRVIKIEPREEGLWIEARIFKNIDEAEETWKLILQGGLQAFSVFGVIKEKQQKQQLDGKMIQHVSKFDLQEIAIVDIPANPDSLFQIVAKSVDNMADSTTEKANDDLSRADQLTQTQGEPKKEVGNEPISTDSTVEKALNQIKNFQQKTLEVLVTLAESNTSIVEKLGEIGQDLVAKDEFDEEELGEDEGFEEEEFKSAPASDITKDLATRMNDLVAKYAKDNEAVETVDKILAENNKLKEQIEELTASKKSVDPKGSGEIVGETESVSTAKAEEIRDKGLEDTVQKAISKVSTETSEEEETQKGDPLRNYLVNKLMNK